MDSDGQEGRKKRQLGGQLGTGRGPRHSPQHAACEAQRLHPDINEQPHSMQRALGKAKSPVD